MTIYRKRSKKFEFKPNNSRSAAWPLETCRSYLEYQCCYQSATFNHEYRVIVYTMYNNYVKVSDTDAE